MENTRRRYLLNGGNKERHSHLVIVIDRTDTVPEEIVRYVRREENIRDVLFGFICNPHYEIWNVFNYDIDLDAQIDEPRPYHIVTPYSKNKIREAYELAEEKHKGQTRLSGAPYITHPLAVAELVSKYFPDHPRLTELTIAAYLHDTVEDTDETLSDIAIRFGSYVAHLVAGVTNDEEMKNKMGKTAYLCNKIVSMDEDTLDLKLCDRLANVKELVGTPDDFEEKCETETSILMSHLLANGTVTETQREIVKDINCQVNALRTQRIMKLVG